MRGAIFGYREVGEAPLRRPPSSAIRGTGSLGRLVGGVSASLDRRRVGGVLTRCLG